MLSLSRRNVVGGFTLLVVGLAAAAASRSVPDDKVPLAIRGYDPVAYFIIGKPTRGLPQFAHAWDEQRYLFSSAENRELFKADPVRYAPQFANFCAVALTRGELVEGNPEYWLVNDGKLYLFGKPIGPELFQQDIAENLSKAEQNRGLVQKN